MLINLLFKDPISFLVIIVAILIALTVHEFAHAWVAERLGDPSARNAGRVTLNPFAHLDPIGTLMLLFIGFGWGKPVPLDPFNFRNPRKEIAIASFAGPASNLIFALVLSLIIRIAHFVLGSSLPYILEIFFAGFIIISIRLAIFNLIPIHPLDGGKILIGLLPEKLAYQWDEILNRLGFFIIIFLILPLFGGYSLVSLIILPIVNFILALLLPGAPLI